MAVSSCSSVIIKAGLKYSTFPSGLNIKPFASAFLYIWYPILVSAECNLKNTGMYFLIKDKFIYFA